MSTGRSAKDNIILFLKGLAMGSANKVPGVSGGMVAFVLGFYEEMIYTFRKVNLKALKLLLNGRFKSLFEYLNITFLLLVMGGSLFSYFSISIILDYLITNYETHVWSAFFGMILGSIYYIGVNYKYWSIKNTLFVLLGILLGASLSYLPPATENSNLWFVFFCGVIGVSGMTIPGLSGSFLLMLMGNYVLLLVDSVNVVFEVSTSIIVGNMEVLEDERNIQYLKIAVTFFMGSLFGLISLSHILGYVLKKWNHIVIALIIGFISGSLGMVWPWKEKILAKEYGVLLLDSSGLPIVENYVRFIPNMNNFENWSYVGFILIGIAMVIGIGFFERKKKSDTI
ncbi:DUF368 domain-containing protein [Flavicella sp.]|uniref:DUF368 domain-containing protein n=1 Tax=Flavicella sp. TaxID=2957742 RepID=UPI00301ADE4B